MKKQRAKIIGISRHHLSTDGDGVTTLVAFHGCIVRLPMIPSHNTDAYREKSLKTLETLGFTRCDLFTYQIRKH